MLHKDTPSASGLVVKFNVAIVEPPVRFRACARIAFVGVFCFIESMLLINNLWGTLCDCGSQFSLQLRFFYVSIYTSLRVPGFGHCARSSLLLILLNCLVASEVIELEDSKG